MAITLVSSPSRDWLPAALPITYVFSSDTPTPLMLFIKLEVSSNGLDFNSPPVVEILNVTPDTSGNYTVNVAPYLEAMFEPGYPMFTGQDFGLFRKYRMQVGEAPGYTGYTGTAELTTTPAHVLCASVQTEAVNGVYPLTTYPGFVNNSSFPGVETKVTISTNQLTTRPVPVATVPNMPCFPYPIELYWLNRSGGWQMWVFGQKHEYEQEITAPVTWQDSEHRTHVASLPPIKEKVNVYSGYIPLAAFNTVFGLLASVRVFHLDKGKFREVQISPGTFQRHKEGQRRKELNFTITYAEPLISVRV
jgi:hypothetical protein